MEELLAQRDLDIQQAARYGQQLLEENRELTRELEKQRLQTISVQEQLESQQQHHLKRCVDLQRTSTSQMEEMETEIVDLLDRLDKSDKETSTERARHELAEKKLRGEITAVEKELRNERSIRERVNQEREDYESKLTNSQQEHDRLREIIKSLRMQVKQQTSENRTLRDHLSHCSQLNEQLSEELRDTRESFEYSEKLRLKAEAQMKQLTDELNVEREIHEQQSLNQSQSLHNAQASQSTASRSTMSLMDEINSLGLEQSDNVFLDNNELMFHRQLMISPDDACTVEQLVHSELQSSSPVAASGWQHQCSRCSELQDQVKRSQHELEQINIQLIDAVKHKFRLQLELEKWESDMEEMVQREIARISETTPNSITKTTPKRRRSSIFQLMPAPKPRAKLLTH